MNHKCNAKVHRIQPPQRNVASTGETMWSLFKTESLSITVDAACQSGNSVSMIGYRLISMVSAGGQYQGFGLTILYMRSCKAW